MLLATLALATALVADDPVRQTAYLKAAEPGAGEPFATAVCAWDDFIAVTTFGQDRGKVTVFRRVQGSWTLQATLQPGDASDGLFFGFDVDGDGDTLVVGAPQGLSPFQLGNGPGAAYVFVHQSGTWTEEARLAASNAEPGDRFGTSVAVSADRVAVGAPGESSGAGSGPDDNSVPDSGAAYVFGRSAGLWSEEARLKSSFPDELDCLGQALVLVGDELVVGAPGENSRATGVDGDPTDDDLQDYGAAFVFQRSGGAWNQTSYLKPCNTGGRAFGSSIAFDAQRIVVGSPTALAFPTCTLTGGAGGGGAYLYERTGATWSAIGALYPRFSGPLFGFGSQVAVEGDRIAVGWSQETSRAVDIGGNEQARGGSGYRSGAVYVFEPNTAQDWEQVGYVKASNAGKDDVFGSSVAMSGTTLVVGAPAEDSAASGIDGDQSDDSLARSGAAYVFELGTSSPGSEYCFGLSCPCGNDDAFGGCANDGPGGPYLSSFGSASVSQDDLILRVAPLPNHRAGLFFMGAGQDVAPFGNGLRCVFAGGVGVFRFAVQSSGSPGRFQLGPGIAAQAATRFPAAGQVIAGRTWNFQAWFRDPMGPCGERTNTSSARSVTFEP